jgi:hypothetical protein
MTAVEMGVRFGVLWDKVESGYFTNSEISEFLTQAQNNYVYQTVFGRVPSQEGILVLSNKDGVEDWQMLLHPLIERGTVPSDASGFILFSEVVDAISNVAASTDILAVLRLEHPTSGVKVKFVRYHQLDAYEDNTFTAFSPTNIGWYLSANRIELEGENAINSYVITVLRKPTAIDIDAQEDCEIGVGAHDKIVSDAVALAKLSLDEGQVQIARSTQ